MIRASREQVVAFRLGGHHLDERLPAHSVLEAAGACGIQNTPPGSAALALHARVNGFAPDAFVNCISAEKSLMQAWSLRGAPYVFPAADAAVFTLGLLPTSDDSLMFFIRGAAEMLDTLRMSMQEVLATVRAGTIEVLNGRRVRGKRALDSAIAEAVGVRLEPARRNIWEGPSPYAMNQRVGEAVVSFALRIVSLEGIICFGGEEGTGPIFTGTEQWIGHPLPSTDGQVARAELVRRYLHCYGPSTVEHFAEWAGISLVQGLESWRLVELELIEVSVAGRPCWLLGRDSDTLATPTAVLGVRFLPPLDPWVQLRDRETLVPDVMWQARIWRGAGWPGTLLHDGRLVGCWRARKQRSMLQVEVDLIQPMTLAAKDAIEKEASSIAPFRGCSAARVSFR